MPSTSPRAADDAHERRGLVYAIHTARPDDVGAVEVVYLTEQDARGYAEDRSRDWRVTSATVTRYVVGQLGTRTPVALYVDGKEQPLRSWAGQRLYPSG